MHYHDEIEAFAFNRFLTIKPRNRSIIFPTAPTRNKTETNPGEMSNLKLLDVKTDDHAPQKWSVALKEDVFKRFLTQGNPTVQKIFGDGSLFSPLLFGKFFDPSDAFPLWEFDSEILLSNLRSTGNSCVDWVQKDHEYVLKAEVPGTWDNNVQIYVDKGKVLEISGKWKQNNQRDVSKDWRCGNWWDHGFVRRLELPEDADSRRIEAKLNSDSMYIELKVPRSCDSVKGKNGASSE